MRTVLFSSLILLFAATPALAQTWDQRVVWSNGSDKAQQCSGDWNCVIRVMRRSGASAQAIAFAQRLHALGNDGWAERFENKGVVDVIDAVYPFRANTNGAVLFVNGQPDIVESEGFRAPTRSTAGPAYRALMTRHPDGFIIGKPSLSRMERTSGGGQRFIITDLFAECRACQPLASINIAYDFDAQGRFLGSRMIAVGRP